MTPNPIEREINIGAVVQVIWNRSRKILGLAMVCAIIVYSLTLLLQNRYAARAQLILDSSKVGVRSLSAGNQASTTTYANFVTGDPLMTKILEEYPQLREEPYELERIDALAGRVTVERVGETNIIEVVVLLEDAELAAEVCNALVSGATELNMHLIRSEMLSTAQLFRDVLGPQTDRTTDLREGYLSMQKNDHIDSFRSLIEVKRTVMEGRHVQLKNLEISQLEMSTTIAKKREALAKLAKILYVRRSLAEDNVLMEAQRRKNPDTTADGYLIASVTVEEINPSYLGLEKEIYDLEAQLAGDLAKKTEYERTIPKMKKEIDEKENLLFDMQMSQEVARTDWLRDFEILSGIAKEEGWVGATVFANRPILHVLNRAVVDTKKDWPKRSLIAGSAGFMVLLLTAAYFILHDLHHFMLSRAVGATETNGTEA